MTNVDKTLGKESTAISTAIRTLAQTHKITNASIAHTIRRSIGYTSLHMLVTQAWNTEDLDRMAPLFGCSNVFDFIDMLYDYIYGSHRKTHDDRIQKLSQQSKTLTAQMKKIIEAQKQINQQITEIKKER